MGKMKELSTVLDEIVTCGETLVQSTEKLRDLTDVIDSLKECGKTLISTGGALRDYFSSPEETEEKPEPKKKTRVKKTPEAEVTPDPEPAEDDLPVEIISKEDVRKVLSEVSQNGHRNEVIALLKKYGAENITSLAEKDYAAVIAEAEVLRDA